MYVAPSTGCLVTRTGLCYLPTQEDVMKAEWTSLVLALALALGACADSPVSVPATPDEESLSPQNVADPSLHVQQDGSGLVLESLTGVALPLIPIELGEVII